MGDNLPNKSPKFSFEFFPPKSDEMEKKLWEAITKLESLNPEFVSVTYGAGGSTRERTHATVKRIGSETSLKAAAHLTCVNASRAEIDEIAHQYWDSGIRHIVALRGDMPDAGGAYIPHPEGYKYAADLVEGLKKIADFEISVAGYPESHPEAISAEDDFIHLKEKVDAGATRVITQFFFNADDYFRFLERARKIGISVPIIPGILPIANFAQATKFSKMCGAKIPERLMKLYEGADENPQYRNMISVITTTELCHKLMEGGVEQFHFYTLNRYELVQAVCGYLKS